MNDKDTLNICAGCGKPFDKTHKLELEHPNLFGGIDRLCKPCVRRMEKHSKNALKEVCHGNKPV